MALTIKVQGGQIGITKDDISITGHPINSLRYSVSNIGLSFIFAGSKEPFVDEFWNEKITINDEIITRINFFEKLEPLFA